MQGGLFVAKVEATCEIQTTDTTRNDRSNNIRGCMSLPDFPFNLFRLASTQESSDDNHCFGAKLKALLSWASVRDYGLSFLRFIRPLECINDTTRRVAVSIRARNLRGIRPFKQMV